LGGRNKGLPGPASGSRMIKKSDQSAGLEKGHATVHLIGESRVRKTWGAGAKKNVKGIKNECMEAYALTNSTGENHKKGSVANQEKGLGEGTRGTNYQNVGRLRAPARTERNGAAVRGVRIPMDRTNRGSREKWHCGILDESERRETITQHAVFRSVGKNKIEDHRLGLGKTLSVAISLSYDKSREKKKRTGPEIWGRERGRVHEPGPEPIVEKKLPCEGHHASASQGDPEGEGDRQRLGVRNTLEAEKKTAIAKGGAQGGTKAQKKSLNDKGRREFSVEDANIKRVNHRGGSVRATTEARKKNEPREGGIGRVRNRATKNVADCRAAM